MSKITPCLWFDHRIQEAVDLYVSLFPNSRITETTHYPEGGMQPAGTVLTIAFELDGRPFTALNGGPMFQFNEAVSFQIDCADQAEVDRYWEALTANGGQESQCGWLKDPYGLSWQVVPRRMLELMSDSDPARAARAMAAMMPMKKIDLAAIERAAAG